MSGRTFSLLCTFIFLVVQLLPTSSEARALPKKLPSAIVVGTVYCDTCFHQDFSKLSHFISGASVVVECADKRDSKSSFREFAKTDELGEFKVQLPMSVSKHVKNIKGCSVKLINSSEPHCSVASSAASSSSSSIHLKSRKDGTHIFSAGFFAFKPLNRPKLCDRNPTVTVEKTTIASISDPNDPSFYPPVQDLPPMGTTFLPPLPELPPLPKLPPLPALPRLPGVVDVNPPGGPRDEKIAGPDVFNPFFPPIPFLPPPSLIPPFPNPLQPPPSILPPVLPTPPPSVFPPLFPSPPTSVFPPILPSPPSNPPSFPFPPLIPGLTPSPPPPATPTFPIPLPPFPFQPVPGFPGIPPAGPH